MNLLNNAEHCPVCERKPVRSDEHGFERVLVFLRCPAGHPYVCCGEDIMTAIANWNFYITLRVAADTHKNMSQMKRNVALSFCRHCAKHTRSRVSFDKYAGDDNRLGYSIINQQCVVCNLTKSSKEAA